MKALTIESSNCLLTKTSCGVLIDNQDIEKLVIENLPEGLENYRNYPVKFSLEIEFLGQEGLSVSTAGYEVKKPESEEGENK